METTIQLLVLAITCAIGVGFGVVGVWWQLARVGSAVVRAEADELLVAIHGDRLATANLRAEADGMMARASTDWNRVRGAESRMTKKGGPGGDGPQIPWTVESFRAAVDSGLLNGQQISEVEAQLGL